MRVVDEMACAVLAVVVFLLSFLGDVEDDGMDSPRVALARRRWRDTR